MRLWSVCCSESFLGCMRTPWVHQNAADDQSRPFGVALLIAGFDEKGPQLYVKSEDASTLTHQIPHRPLRHLCPLRRESDRLRLRRGATSAARRFPQGHDARRGPDTGAQGVEAGHGGEA